MAQKKYVSLEKLSLYNDKIKKVITDGDADALANAKQYFEDNADRFDVAGAAATAKTELQGKIDALANGAVATNTAAIAKLNGDASTAGSVAKAVADSAATLQASIDAVDAIADQNAADIDTLEGKVAALEAGTYDDTEVRGLISANTDAIDALEETHGTDKTALEGAIALKADKTALDAVSEVANAAVKQSDYNTKVAALEAEDERIAGLVTAEVDRATEVEADFEERIAKMEVFWDTTEDADGVVNKLKEIQDYIAGDETGAAEMAGNIQANTQAIADMDAAYKLADTTLQGNIDKKADASVVEAIDGRVGALETASAKHALKTEVQAVSDALNEYKDAHTGDYTNDKIDELIKVVADDVAALNDTYASDEELTQAIEDEVSRANGAYAAKSLETTVSEHKADTVAHITADERTAWNASEQNAKDYADGLNTAMTTKVDGAIERIGANETAIGTLNTTVAGKAAQSDLEAAVARIAANETAIANFVEVSEQEVLDLFK